MYHEGKGSPRGAQPQARKASPQQRLRGHIRQGIAQASRTQLQPACINLQEHLERASAHSLRLLALSVHARDGHFWAAGQKGRQGTQAALCKHSQTGRNQSLLQGKAPAGSMGSTLGSTDGYSAVHGLHSLLKLPVPPPPCLQRSSPSGLSSTAFLRAGDLG